MSVLADGTPRVLGRPDPPTAPAVQALGASGEVNARRVRYRLPDYLSAFPAGVSSGGMIALLLFSRSNP